MSPSRRRPPAGDPREQIIELAGAYRDGTLGAPSPFFPAPELPQIRATPAGAGPLGTQIVDLAFASGYQPFLPAAREPYLAIHENLTVHARWWTDAERRHGRPTIVLIHGWGQGTHWVTERAFNLPYWLRHGYDVVSFVLPFHGARAPGRSGARFPGANPMRPNEGVGHAIDDLRALAMVLRARGATHIGALGMSLGGYTTALWASVAGPSEAGGLEFAIAMIPAVSFARLYWSHGEDSPARRRAESAGISEDLLADAFAVHAPMTRPSRVPAERLYVIAGRGDRITPPEQAEALAAHWGRDVVWFDGGHLAQVGRGDALRAVRRSLGAHTLQGRTFRG